MQYILHVISGLHDGGAEAVLYRLCGADRGNRHHVVSLMGPGKYGPLLQAEGIKVTYLNMPRRRITLAGIRMLWLLIRREKPDLVQTWMYHADLIGGIVARIAGQRRVFWGVHHTMLDPTHSPRSTIAVARACARLSRIVPRGIICCAEEARQVHASLGYEAKRMRVIPNGYDISVFRPDPAAGAALRATLGIASNRAVIGLVARFDPQKDHATLLQAMARLKAQGEAPLCLLVGSGVDPNNADLKAQIVALDLQDDLRLLGRRSDIPAVMNALDLHVSSSSFGEAFPNVLAEAMACGTLCVATHIGDAALILGATGRIVPPRDPEALAAAIAYMLAIQRQPQGFALRQAAVAHISTEFTLERMVERYHAAWAES